MTKLLSTITLVIALYVPSSALAYFPSHFEYSKTSTSMTPKYVQDPKLDLLPGWPDWIGRLNVFSQYLFGTKFENLNLVQKQTVEKLSKNWPDWIGVPFFLR